MPMMVSMSSEMPISQVMPISMKKVITLMTPISVVMFTASVIISEMMPAPTMMTTAFDFIKMPRSGLIVLRGKVFI